MLKSMKTALATSSALQSTTNSLLEMTAGYVAASLVTSDVTFRKNVTSSTMSGLVMNTTALYVDLVDLSSQPYCCSENRTNSEGISEDAVDEPSLSFNYSLAGMIPVAVVLLVNKITYCLFYFFPSMYLSNSPCNRLKY